MYKNIVLPLLVMWAAHPYGFTQDAGTAPALQIIISLPAEIPPETVWVRYSLIGPNDGRISRGEALPAGSGSLYPIAPLDEGAPAEHARLVIYAPGCQFAMYDLDLRGESETTIQFRCDPLPTKTVHGFLRPEEIPSIIGVGEKKLDIAGFLDGNWICNFFFQPIPDSNFGGGSCLGSDITLGTVAQLDPARKGNFKMTIPDFTRDPVIRKFARQGRFGIIGLALKNKDSGHILGFIHADKSAESGLNVQREYRDPVTFTTAQQ